MELTPHSMAALAKKVLGYEHPSVRFGTAIVGLVYYWTVGGYSGTALAPADALDMLAAGAWRAVRERWEVDIGMAIVDGDGEDPSTWHVRATVHPKDTPDDAIVDIRLAGYECACADPANIFALLTALDAAGVKAEGK